MSTPNSKIKLNQARFAQGLCQKCGKNPYEDTKKFCGMCLLKAKQQRDLRRLKLESENKCRDCGQINDSLFKRCTSCRNRTKEFNRNRILTKLCLICGNKIDNEFQICSICKIKNLNSREKRLSLGKCSSCGKKREFLEKVLCNLCSNKEAEKHFLLKKEVMQVYGGKCQCCGDSGLGRLSIDHIKENGAEHRRQLKTSSIYKWLKKNNYPKEFRVLCMSCNLCYYILGECIH